MGKRFTSSAKSYAKNIGIHMMRVIFRRERAGDALAGLSKDAKKLKRSLVAGPSRAANRKKARRIVQEGRIAYNSKQYGRAEEVFREAISADNSYGLAHTYLGHTLYQQGRIKEAIGTWERAIEADPGSAAASKARKKLQHLEKNKGRVVSELKERLRRD